MTWTYVIVKWTTFDHEVVNCYQLGYELIDKSEVKIEEMTGAKTSMSVSHICKSPNGINPTKNLQSLPICAAQTFRTSSWSSWSSWSAFVTIQIT